MCEACIMSPVRATGRRWERLYTLKQANVYMRMSFVFCPYEEESQYLTPNFNDIFNFN